MKWDEDVYGLEYDLDIFMIVAIDDFNMGAMENKGLNVFNSKLVLANPETATDLDYHSIEAVIGHEYFHNWTGNRVTCRDWFQLSLKEGLTVFRDQQFSADMGSGALDARIDDVRRLRAGQFPRMPGRWPIPCGRTRISRSTTSTPRPCTRRAPRWWDDAHAARAGALSARAWISISSAMTARPSPATTSRTPWKLRSGVDLTQFRRWYCAGRHAGPQGRRQLRRRQPALHDDGRPESAAHAGPTGEAADAHSAVRRTARRRGSDLPLRLAGEAAAGGSTRVLDVRNPRDVFVFEDVLEKPGRLAAARLLGAGEARGAALGRRTHLPDGA